MPDPGEQVHALDPMPPHLWQLDKAETVQSKGAPESAYNDMGCGAYSTTVAMAYYDNKFNSYQFATDLYAHMGKVIFSHGTWEGENARQAQNNGFVSAQLHNGTAAELADLIRVNAPAVLNIDPHTILMVTYGAHDITLVGFSGASDGTPLKIFALDPWLQPDSGSIANHPDYPGNRYFVANNASGDKLSALWTGIYTPIFKSAAHARAWIAIHPARAGSFNLGLATSASARGGRPCPRHPAAGEVMSLAQAVEFALSSNSGAHIS